MALVKKNRRGIFRAIAVALLAVCAGFTFPESHYSEEKTYVQAPSPQAEVYSLLCDDVEDSNDFSTGAHFFHSTTGIEIVFSAERASAGISTKNVSPVICKEVYLLHGQLLI